MVFDMSSAVALVAVFAGARGAVLLWHHFRGLLWM